MREVLRPDQVRAHLAQLSGEQLDAPAVDTIDRIAAAGSGWRYAAAVRDSIAMQRAPGDAARILDEYISTFGNNVRAWAQAALHDEARPALLTLLSRELRYGSHEPDVWRALSLLVSDNAVEDEVDSHLTSRLATAVS